MKDIYNNSSEIEKLSNALIATCASDENSEMLLLLTQIKAKNYENLDLLNSDNFEVISDDAFAKHELEIKNIFESIEYKNAKLVTAKTSDWSIKGGKPTSELKRTGFYPIEASNTLWGKDNRSVIVMEFSSGNDCYAGLVVRTLQDTLDEFKNNFSLKLNFCSTSYFVKEIDKNLFVLIFIMEQKSKLAEVELSYSNPRSPHDLGIGEDRRNLSFCLSEILTIEKNGVKQ